MFTARTSPAESLRRYYWLPACGGLAGLVALGIVLLDRAPVRLSAQTGPGRPAPSGNDAGGAVRLLPFEGRLTTTSGQPLVAGTKAAVSFILYDAPEDGRVVLGPLKDNIIFGPGGQIRTVLKADAPGLADVDFSRPLYLGVRAEGGLEARSRTPILPIPFAHRAARATDADRLGGQTWERHAADVRGWIQETGRDGVPVGTVLPFAGLPDAVPTQDGWLPCDGRPAKRADYPELFEVVRTTYGDGSHAPASENSAVRPAEVSGFDFNLPDYRGLFLRGVDAGRGQDPDAASRTSAPAGPPVGDRVGSFQGHATARPSGAGREFVTDSFGPFDPANGTAVYLCHGDGGDSVHEDTDFTAGELNIRHGGRIREIPKHNHKVTAGGDAETRPSNTSVVYMIKIKSWHPAAPRLP